MKTTFRVAVSLFFVLLGCANVCSQSTFVVSLSGENRLDTYSVVNNKLEKKSETALECSPGFSIFSESGNYLFVGCSEPPSILVLAQQANGFEQIQTVELPGKPSFLEISPNGRFLLASYYQQGLVTVHRIDDDAKLSKAPLQTVKVDERAHGIAIHESGKYVFVPHTRPNSITQFRLNSGTGKLTLNEPAKHQREENIGPRHLRFHPTRRDYAYGSNEQGRSISLYRMNANNGSLNHLQTTGSIPKDFTEKSTTSHVEVHPNGKSVYVANRKHGTLSVFAISNNTAQVELLEREPTESTVRSFGISPDGRNLVAAGQRSGKLVFYSIADNGMLDRTDAIEVGQKPWWIAFSPPLRTSRITDDSQHNAFTDLVLWNSKACCTFRKGERHVHGKDGIIEVLKSTRHGMHSIGQIKEEGIDLRDPKLSLTPDGRLMVLFGGSKYVDKKLVSRSTRVVFRDSDVRSRFSEITPVVIDSKIRTENDWLWRVTWHKETAYGVVYQPGGLHLVKSVDGVDYSLVQSFDLPGRPNESTIRFEASGRMRIVVRNEETGGGHLGIADAPYQDFQWHEIDQRLGGPDLIQLPGGQWILGTREYGNPNRTILGRLSDDGKFEKLFELPSSGDTSYPGMDIVEGKLWVSYYSSHSGNSQIHLVKIPLFRFNNRKRDN